MQIAPHRIQIQTLDTVHSVITHPSFRRFHIGYNAAKAATSTLDQRGAAVVATDRCSGQCLGVIVATPINPGTQIPSLFSPKIPVLIEALFVTPLIRGQGVAGQLFRAIRKHIDKRGVDLALIGVASQPYDREMGYLPSWALKNLYRNKFGFIPITSPRQDGCLLLVKGYSPEVQLAILEELQRGGLSTYKYGLDHFGCERRGYDIFPEIMDNLLTWCGQSELFAEYQLVSLRKIENASHNVGL